MAEGTKASTGLRVFVFFSWVFRVGFEFLALARLK
jgi:hypothetical protein